ncbi:MAG: hypothetical protein M1514_01835 [Patescibacteria group bacterium]|nr:hypothetical protein [Patescibacteria group bacterium]
MKKKYLFFFFGLIIPAAIVFFLYRKSYQKPMAKTLPSTLVSEAKVNPRKEINKDFTLSFGSGRQKTVIRYLIESAEVTDEIVVKGQKYKAVSGRSFLILNLKITNEGSEGVQISSRDFVRLSLNGQGEKIAPEIHNDPVEVQAISTKLTRLGFTINSNEKQFVLSLGEIKGEKQTVELSF